MNVRNHYGAAGGGEFNADRASHEGNADVVLAHVSDERSVDEKRSARCEEIFFYGTLCNVSNVQERDNRRLRRLKPGLNGK